MQEIKSIEFYDNGEVKRIEFYESKLKILPSTPSVCIPSVWDWTATPPGIISSGSTGAMDIPNLVTYQATASSHCCSIMRDLDTPEEDAAWAHLSEVTG